METKERDSDRTDYASLFRKATGDAEPFPFQKEFAVNLPSLVRVPTGLGKTAMAVLGWLWRRRFADESVRQATPRRLVYCLPMRVLVEQTRDNSVRWLNRLDLLAGKAGFEGDKLVSYSPPSLSELRTTEPERIAIYVIMGGEDEPEWDVFPERDAIIIGTQDMLLSRALNRGYAASRARWPMQFGMLHTDCLWVFDEIQLMGSGLATTAQLEAFRHSLGSKDGHGCRSVWMSATLRPEWLDTVDYGPILNATPESRRLEFRMETEIEDPAINASAKQALTARWNAKKDLSKATSAIDSKSQKSLAEEIIEAHSQAKGRTIVVVNTVGRACNLLAAIRNEWPAATDDNLVLVHSRFRPPERTAQIEKLKAETPPNRLPDEGMIVVSTQVIEAGVDVSATTLFTELAPWPSLVQRFGRCNRNGEVAGAQVWWIDLPAKDADAEKVRFPYDLKDLRAAAAELKTLSDVGLGSLTKHAERLSHDKRKALFPHEHTHVIRRKDLIDLFDTTPDLAGNDIDIDRYVRDIDDSDVRVFWREWDLNDPRPPVEKSWRCVGRDELCPAPIVQFKSFATSDNRKSKVWRWDFSEGRWEQVRDKGSIYPGQTYLAHASTGGYDPDKGWMGTGGTAPVELLDPVEPEGLSDDAYDDDGLSKTVRWRAIAEHTDEVCNELDAILASLPLNNDAMTTLQTAARWHDWGKAHELFQAVLPDGAPKANELWAKASGQWKRYRDVKRPHFRHELASALAVLQRPHDDLKSLSDDDLNLVAYLIAAHHGKVRLSIRSMPNETRPRDENGKRLDDCRFARGVWEIDSLPETNLGSDNGTPIIAPAVERLSLEPMEIGLCEEPPFAGQPSWLERAIKLRDSLGPFRLANLEALLRAADWRASAAALEKEQPGPAEEVPRA